MLPSSSSPSCLLFVLHELSGEGSNLVDELRLFLGGHGLEGRDSVAVFFRLGDAMAADEDVRKGRGEGETQKRVPYWRIMADGTHCREKRPSFQWY